MKRLLLRESQAQPLVVVFEDLHWIDGETQALLDSLVESLPTARLLLLVNYRPEYQHGWGGKTYYTPAPASTRLPAERAKELLEALLGDDAGLAPAQATPRRARRGQPVLPGGNRPDVGRDQGAGRRAWRLSPAPGPSRRIQIPSTVQAMLAARIDRLAAEEKHLLQIAAVIGTDVPSRSSKRSRLSLKRCCAPPRAPPEPRSSSTRPALFPDLEYTLHACADPRGGIRKPAPGSPPRAPRPCADRIGRRRRAITSASDPRSWPITRCAESSGHGRALSAQGEKAMAGARYEAAIEFHEAAVGAIDRLGPEDDSSCPRARA